MQSISKMKVVTGLNQSQKAEELYIAAEAAGAGADLLDYHIEAIEKWKRETGTSSAILNDAMREFKCLSQKLRDSQGIMRTCAPIVSPLKNAAGAHAELERRRKEDAAIAAMESGGKKRSSGPFDVLSRYNFHLHPATSTKSAGKAKVRAMLFLFY